VKGKFLLKDKPDFYEILTIDSIGIDIWRKPFQGRLVKGETSRVEDE